VKESLVKRKIKDDFKAVTFENNEMKNKIDELERQILEISHSLKLSKQKNLQNEEKIKNMEQLNIENEKLREEADKMTKINNEKSTRVLFLDSIVAKLKNEINENESVR
jgi:protein tyrosine/serine phosphatase